MDTLEIFGLEYQNVAGFKATDDNNNILTYIRPTGTQTVNVTQNGTTTVDVTAYENAQITANVPNTYTSSDEGKVVSNGALVAQGSDTVTQNGTVDTTLTNSLTVNVSGGGGGSTVVASGTFTGAGAAEITIPVGSKMPKTNFLFMIFAQDESEYPYSTLYKVVAHLAVVDGRLATYDLTSDGTISADGVTQYTYNNSGEITQLTWSGLASGVAYQRNTSIGNAGTGAYPKIIRASSGFSVKVYQTSQYPYPAGIVYEWRIVYYGSNPSTDIVEVT